MKRERGSILLYGLVALGVTVFAGGLVYTYKSAIQRAEAAETEARQSRERLDEALMENAQMRLLRQQEAKILLERQKQSINMTDLERKLDALLAKHLQRPEIREWAATPIPPALLDSLRPQPLPPRSAPDRKAPAAGKPVTNHPRPGLRISADQLGLTGACQETPVHCAFLSSRQGGYFCLVPI